MLQALKAETTSINSCNHCVYINRCVKEEKTAVLYVGILLTSWVVKLIFLMK